MKKLSDSDFEGFEFDLDDILCERDYIYSLINNVEWDSQLQEINLLLKRNRRAREKSSDYIKRDKEELESYIGPHRDHFVDQHVELLHETIYQDAAESMAAIGMIAPMVESILCQSLAALGRRYQEKKIPPPEHKRWTRADKSNLSLEKRWNCQIYFNSNNDAKII